MPYKPSGSLAAVALQRVRHGDVVVRRFHSEDRGTEDPYRYDETKSQFKLCESGVTGVKLLVLDREGGINAGEGCWRDR